MKKNAKLAKQIDETLAKVDSLTRHIQNVQDNCLLLGKRLIENGEIDLGKKLIANGFIHDASKFNGIEWDNLLLGKISEEEIDKARIKMAIYHHNHTNLHHPEAWGHIHNMPILYLVELLCDWKSRSEEFGTALLDYINDHATKRFNFSKEDEVYKVLMKYYDLLCDKPFEKIV